MELAIDPAELQRNAADAVRLLKALANENRLLVLCQLVGGERSVGQLVATVGLSQSALSQHLALLREDGLVATRRDGQTIWYSLSGHGVPQVLEVLANLFCAPRGGARVRRKGSR